MIDFQVTFVPRSLIDNKPALVQVMAWHRRGDIPLPEPMLTQFIDAYMQHEGEMSLCGQVTPFDVVHIVDIGLGNCSDVKLAPKRLKALITGRVFEQFVQQSKHKSSASLAICEGNPPVTQLASNVKTFSCHYPSRVLYNFCCPKDVFKNVFLWYDVIMFTKQKDARYHMKIDR